MFFSRLDNNETQNTYPAPIRKALEWLKNADIMSMEPGRYYIDGDKMFANIENMTTHFYEGSHPEVHKKYVDLMYWPEGGEKIGFASCTGDEKIIDSHPENDMYYLESVEHENFLISHAGCIGVFFPWDAHRPSLVIKDKPETSRKCTVKISIELF